MMVENYTFHNPYALEYQIKDKYYLESVTIDYILRVFPDISLNKYDTPIHILDDLYKINQYVSWLHKEFKDHITPINKNSSRLYKKEMEKENKVILKSTQKRINKSSVIEIVNLDYIDDLEERIKRLERLVDQKPEYTFSLSNPLESIADIKSMLVNNLTKKVVFKKEYFQDMTNDKIEKFAGLYYLAVNKIDEITNIIEYENKWFTCADINGNVYDVHYSLVPIETIAWFLQQPEVE